MAYVICVELLQSLDISTWNFTINSSVEIYKSPREILDPCRLIPVRVGSGGGSQNLVNNSLQNEEKFSGLSRLNATAQKDRIFGHLPRPARASTIFEASLIHYGMRSFVPTLALYRAIDFSAIHRKRKRGGFSMGIMERKRR
jgi:hypothetical protein